MPEGVATWGLTAPEAACAVTLDCQRARHSDVTEPRWDDLLEGPGALWKDEWTGGRDVRLERAGPLRADGPARESAR